MCHNGAGKILVNTELNQDEDRDPGLTSQPAFSDLTDIRSIQGVRTWQSEVLTLL